MSSLLDYPKDGLLERSMISGEKEATAQVRTPKTEEGSSGETTTSTCKSVSHDEQKKRKDPPSQPANDSDHIVSIQEKKTDPSLDNISFQTKQATDGLQTQTQQNQSLTADQFSALLALQQQQSTTPSYNTAAALISQQKNQEQHYHSQNHQIMMQDQLLALQLVQSETQLRQEQAALLRQQQQLMMTTMQPPTLTIAPVHNKNSNDNKRPRLDPIKNENPPLLQQHPSGGTIPTLPDSRCSSVVTDSSCSDDRDPVKSMLPAPQTTTTLNAVPPSVDDDDDKNKNKKGPIFPPAVLVPRQPPQAQPQAPSLPASASAPLQSNIDPEDISRQRLAEFVLSYLPDLDWMKLEDYVDELIDLFGVGTDPATRQGYADVLLWSDLDFMELMDRRILFSKYTGRPFPGQPKKG